MIDPLAFTLAALALLIAPGPTNTLLATSGAAAGIVRSLPLTLATALGYVIATLAVALILTPLAQLSHALGVALRVACGAYLLFAAWRLWRESKTETGEAEPVRFQRVLLATSLNPKALVFATWIVPFLAPPEAAAAPYLFALGAMAALVALSWIALGSSLRAGARMDARLARRAGALVLGVFALLVGGSAFTA